MILVISAQRHHATATPVSMALHATTSTTTQPTPAHVHPATLEAAVKVRNHMCDKSAYSFVNLFMKTHGPCFSRTVHAMAKTSTADMLVLFAFTIGDSDSPPCM